ncbi:hypothetical protein [Mucilaginibacter sp.]|uniref:hypothetical protein n=1 Tax=Mucilaginibacter sp. TaxID=1882438 RepID=UPI00261FD1FB|nr:hypothetical protein [Mucilaginibacter sp.]MDB5029722.1 hypothetical protein [Mucilaginibacter sp.]
MFNIFSSIKTPTLAIVEGWQKRYGKDLAVLELDNKKAYVRLPTDGEVKKIIKKLTSSGKSFNETKYLKMVLEVCWLGGDKELMNNHELIKENLKVWQTL